MKRFCVIEFPEEFYEMKRRDLLRDGDRAIYCLSEDVRDLLQEEGVEHQMVNEDDFVPEWDEISMWAKRASLTWFSETSASDILSVDGVSLADAINLSMAYTLVHQIKNQRILQNICPTQGPCEVIVFKDYPSMNSKRCEDTQSLNYALGCYARERGWKTKELNCSVSRLVAPAFKDSVRLLLGLFYGFFSLMTLTRRTDYLAFGSIKDMHAILKNLPNKFARAYVDDMFRWNHFKNCLFRGISYMVLDAILSPWARWSAWYDSRRILKRAHQHLAGWVRSPSLCYRGSVIGCLDAAMHHLLEREIPKSLLLMRSTEKLLRQVRPLAFIMHADTATYRIVALTTKARGHRVVIISHGMPPVRGDWRNHVPSTGLGETIVNSEFELTKYILTGRDPKLLHNIGLPRYDLIYERIQSASQHNHARPLILYCPHRLTSFTKSRSYLLGVHTSGQQTRENTLAVIEASEANGCDLVIKPHDNHDASLWNKLIKQHGTSHTKLVSYSDNIFDWLHQSDIVITTFSTVVIEAMLFDKMVITINFTGRADYHPYAKRGISLGVYDRNNLKSAVKDCLENSIVREKLAQSRKQELSYFGGRFDGKNTKRVIDFICRESHG